MRDGSSLSWETWKAIAKFQTAITGGMAVATMVAPRTLLRLFGVAPEPGTVLFFRGFGAALAFVAVIHHGAEDTRDVATVRTIALANLVEDGLLALLSANGLARGTLGKAGWLLVGTFAAEVAVNAWVLAKLQEGEPAEVAP